MRKLNKVYYGKPSGLPAYCEGLGKTPPPYSNIGEFFLEVVDEYETAGNVEVWQFFQSALQRRIECETCSYLVAYSDIPRARAIDFSRETVAKNSNLK